MPQLDRSLPVPARDTPGEPPGRRRGGLGALASLAALLALGGAAAGAATGGGYAPGDAAAGASVYANNCAQCHGANLGGGAGPPLVGASIKSGYKTPAALYDFIKTQMPANAPNSLSAKQYADVTAFVLSKNGGAPANGAAMGHGKNEGTPRTGTVGTVAGTKKGARTGAQAPGNQHLSAEIVRAAPPTTKVFAKLPAGANVSISDAMMRGAGGDGKDWLIDGRTYDNQRYSPLTQIDSKNVGSLAPVALVQTGITASFETTPIVVSGVMYLTTPVVENKMKIMAVNAASGAKLWETTYNLGPFQICCGPVNRGAAVAYGRVYVVTLDDKLVALDATSGKLAWQKSVADASTGYSETMAPVAYDGMVIVGSAGGEWAIRGFVAAYDARSGNQRWRWNATDPKTYSGTSWRRGGAMVWTTPAIDPATNQVIFSTGNPNPDLDGTPRKGDNLWSDSIVSLDVHTGKLKWYYQEVKHDVWDYDAVSPVVLFDVDVDGKTVHAAGEAGKVGWFYIVDRTTGKLIRRSDAYVKMSKNMFTTPTAKGVKMLPGANGGAEWSPPAYSPQTKNVYVLAMDQLMNFATHSVATATGHIRLGSAFSNVTPGGLQDGPLVAINTQTGKIAWTAMTKDPLIGGALATAGNLVFMGEGNGDFDAFDATTGQKLWRYNLGAGVNAPPISYEVNGEQYVAVAAGGNFQLGYPLGDTVAIFKLVGTPAAK
jgi:alcohol dehydrogenase (cytochrome c)